MTRERPHAKIAKERKTESLLGKGDLVASGVISGGTFHCRRMKAIFHGRYGDGSLPEAGSEIGEIRETRERETKLRPDARLAGHSQKKKKRGLISSTTDESEREINAV